MLYLKIKKLRIYRSFWPCLGGSLFQRIKNYILLSANIFPFSPNSTYLKSTYLRCSGGCGAKIFRGSATPSLRWFVHCWPETRLGWLLWTLTPCSSEQHYMVYLILLVCTSYFPCWLFSSSNIYISRFQPQMLSTVDNLRHYPTARV